MRRVSKLVIMSAFEDQLDALVTGNEAIKSEVAGWIGTQAAVAATVSVPSELLHSDDLQSSLAGWSAWLEAMRPSGDAVLLDNTTVVNAMELIYGAPPSANTLMDLNTLLTAVTYYDCAVRLEHRLVEGQIREPVQALNDAAGHDLVRTLVVSDADGGRNPGVIEVLQAQWREAERYVTRLEATRPSSWGKEDLDEIKSSLELILGRPVPEPLFDLADIRATYSSDVYSGKFLEWKILDVEKYDMWRPILRGEGTDGLYRKLITEAAIQSGFNCQLGNVLNVPYLPNHVRTPYRELHYKRDRQLTHCFESLEGPGQTDLIHELNLLWREPLESLGPWITLPLPLTYCLSKLPKRKAEPEDWFNSIGELRRAMEGFRQHRRDLQDALDRRDAAELRNLAAALQQGRASAWGRGLAQRWLLSVPVAVVTGMLGNLPEPVLIAVALATGLAELPDAALASLKDRLGRRRLRFASEVGPAASELLNWIPAVAKAWDISDSTAQNIAPQLAAFRRLERTPQRD